MKKQKGAGLLLVVIVTFFISIVLFVILRKPNTVGLEIDGVDPNKSIIEQSSDIVNQAKKTKDLIEQRGDISEYLQ